ncbi:hypothetical protein [Hyalangium sp.]|uniref:hypothetical protein n=1 Tax=Hyalangium sp. TaxID=2028555 RepID=UPI002D68233B|nr:hypothetical protein [Hyalangium sp.]HYI01506.1 hypothetical protein [Hyalangium sp.]
MTLKRTLLLLVLALVHLPLVASANSLDTDECGTPYPFWWKYDGPHHGILVKDWNIQPEGDRFRIRFALINASAETVQGGMPFTVSHTAVDRAGYGDPTAQVPPANVRAVLGTEALAQGTLPTLRVGESTTVEAYAQRFHADANHILTVIFHDGGQIALSFDPQPQPWYWLRILSPSSLPGALELSRATVEPVSSSLEGYKANAVRLALRNVSGHVLEAGTPISLIHGSSGSAGGYWGPDDVVDPNDPGNPYANIFREVLSQGVLAEALYPGATLELGGVVHVPEGITTLKQITVVVGE